MRFMIRRVLKFLLGLSFLVMVGIGFLMAYGLVPAGRAQQGLELAGWHDFDWSDLRKSIPHVFFVLATVNLVVVWAWLIRCAASGDFLRLAGGLLVGAAIIGTLIFLTPSYCSRSPRLKTGQADGRGFSQKEFEKTDTVRKAAAEAGDHGGPPMPFSGVRSASTLPDANHKKRSAAGRG